MYPQTVNAVNLPLQNALNFPVAILQPPFFDPLAPPEVNYGAIGSVIGHEISLPSTPKAAPSTPKARCATGGSPPTWPTSTPPPPNSPRNTTPTNLFQILP